MSLYLTLVHFGGGPPFLSSCVLRSLVRSSLLLSSAFLRGEWRQRSGVRKIRIRARNRFLFYLCLLRMFAMSWNWCVSCKMSFKSYFHVVSVHVNISFPVFYVSRVGGRDNVLTPGVKGWALVAQSKDVSLNPHSPKRKKVCLFPPSVMSDFMCCICRWVDACLRRVWGVLYVYISLVICIYINFWYMTCARVFVIY